MPREFESLVNRYTQENSIADDELLIPKSKRTVQYWVEQAAENAVDATDDNLYRRVSTHDL